MTATDWAVVFAGVLVAMGAGRLGAPLWVALILAFVVAAMFRTLYERYAPRQETETDEHT